MPDRAYFPGAVAAATGTVAVVFIFVGVVLDIENCAARRAPLYAVIGWRATVFTPAVVLVGFLATAAWACHHMAFPISAAARVMARRVTSSLSLSAVRYSTHSGSESSVRQTSTKPGYLSVSSSRNGKCFT